MLYYVITGLYIDYYVIYRSLCAIANEEQGGSIYIGVREDGSIQGIKLKRTAVRYDIMAMYLSLSLSLLFLARFYSP